MVDMICACWLVCSLAICTVLSETSVRQVLLRPTRVFRVAWAANISFVCMLQERFVLLARRLGRYLSFAANGSGRSGGWGRLVGQMYRIWLIAAQRCIAC